MRKDLANSLLLFLFLGGFHSNLKAQYAVNGDAVQNGNCVLLTPDQLWQSSSVWYLDKVDISQRFELWEGAC